MRRILGFGENGEHGDEGNKKKKKVWDVKLSEENEPEGCGLGSMGIAERRHIKKKIVYAEVQFLAPKPSDSGGFRLTITRRRRGRVLFRSTFFISFIFYFFLFYILRWDPTPSPM